MSTINSSSGISDTSFVRAGLEPTSGQGSIDALRGRDQGLADLVFDPQVGGGQDQASLSQTDAGEDVLNASAWDDVANGDRLLSGDPGLEASLGQMDLSQAADSAADAVLGALY